MFPVFHVGLQSILISNNVVLPLDFIFMHTSQFWECRDSILLVWSEIFISIISVCYQGFVSAVSHMRSFVPAVYDVTVAIPKTQPSPTMLRLFKGQPSAVSQQKLRILINRIYHFVYSVQLPCGFEFPSTLLNFVKNHPLPSLDPKFHV